MSDQGTDAGADKGGADKGGDDKGGAPKFDMGAVYGALTPDNKEFATKRGYIKADGSFGDVNLWLDGHRNAERVMGGEKLSVPDLSDEAKRAGWEGWEKLGAPKDAKGYQFKRPEMPKGANGQPIAYDEAAENGFRDLAAKLKMPQFMFDAIMTSEVGNRLARQANDSQTVNNERERVITELKKEHGPQGYDAAMNQGRAALVHMAKLTGMDAGKVADMASHEFGSLETAKLFIKMASMLGEGTLQGGREAGFATGPAAARAELDRLNMDAEFQKSFNTADHPGHADAVKRRAALAAQAHGG